MKNNKKERISIFPALKTREELMELPMRFHGSERTIATVVLMTTLETLDRIEYLRAVKENEDNCKAFKSKSLS